ncbi:MAG TPA: glycoside hydrolase family 15 protein [Acidimicrobiia bacterium]|jgi:GH15 family glucan-1,4-alpha-glucosidase|nr:glycoside hydrolase family 15 protein [Acidimicrobiia bacterium]
MPSRIEQYALIGDTSTSGLVADDGSLDWLCLPRFDAAACFAALLGDESHGRWLLAPKAGGRAECRQYRRDTLILETEFETPEGRVRVIDFMPVSDHSVDVVRIVEGMRGRVDMRMELVIRFDYGSVVPWVLRTGGALHAIAGPDSLVLRTPVHAVGRDLRTEAEFTVTAKDRVPFVLSYHSSEDPSPPPVDPEAALRRCTDWWRRWVERGTVDGDWAGLVRRSAITLKALTYHPTGGLIAAPTTSLPEAIGGVRNWDYRYCWIRDATFSLYALLTLGYEAEARAWREWLVRAVAGSPAHMQIMYGPSGERRLTELELDWLPGYEGSRPVRTGNAASAQFQLDVYGEIADTLHVTRKLGIPPSRAVAGIGKAILEFLEDGWRQPDDGIWEVRGPRRDFTHSKVMAWVAFDRAVKSIEKYSAEVDIDVGRLRASRDEIHAEVLARGFDRKRNSFVQCFGSKELDASLLMIPLVGFLPPDDPKVQGTVAAIGRELMPHGFVRRYQTEQGIDGLPPGEGAFLPCSFWYADNLALMGRLDEARALYERLIGLCNDVGLLSEEYDPVEQRLLGNFPQAMSHVALVNTAANLTGKVGPARSRSGLVSPRPSA